MTRRSDQPITVGDWVVDNDDDRNRTKLKVLKSYQGEYGQMLLLDPPEAYDQAVEAVNFHRTSPPSTTHKRDT